ncbi:MAG: hypothetical protein IPJ00_08325 [Saprospirales bacterium]|nr:hypothetical protein [Saprospirales bacterium]
MKRIQVAQKKQAKVQPANAPDQRESDHEPTATLQPPTLQLKSSAPVQLRALSDRQVQVIANNVKEAVKGWGTDEEAIFQNLQRLQRDAEDIAELKKEYKARFSVDIETDLRDDLSGDELRLALSLITPKADKKGPETNMVAGETDQNNFDSQAERLRNAMEGIGTNEAEVYAVLSPYEGDYLKLSKLKTAYFNKTGRSLSTDVDDEFSGDEKKFALRLLNGAYPEADGDIMGAYHSERAEKRFASLGIFENIQFCIQLILAKNYQERQWLSRPWLPTGPSTRSRPLPAVSEGRPGNGCRITFVSPAALLIPASSNSGRTPATPPPCRPSGEKPTLFTPWKFTTITPIPIRPITPAVQRPIPAWRATRKPCWKVPIRVAPPVRIRASALPEAISPQAAAAGPTTCSTNKALKPDWAIRPRKLAPAFP